ncbi:MAG: hypothetical protein AVDCRST_MAG78-1306 [uncultured Rubrobacteraceae bacterium]|uniref:Uncharacterized protein n=1 Tax=uncultured Rubrobacteraceae bacterium TaxID=349277 RepID=A0A6J4PVG3_9ACTN|nr:MAG: hypothetical protein AVDCRST_MAG78-1306 [uncultured Rubrobacteraceae bacterium]
MRPSNACFAYALPQTAAIQVPKARPSRIPRGEAETGVIAITILLVLSEKFQEGDR